MNTKRELLIESKKVDGKLIAIGSTEAVDRMGDVVKADGWDLKNFKKNPVLLFAHKYDEPPIGYAKNIKVVDKQLIFEPVFHEITQLAREIKAMFMADPAIMQSWSVGFIPKKFDEKDFHIITESELLEVSAVPVPANQEALMMAAKSFNPTEEKEVHGWFEKMAKQIDGEEKLEEPKAEEKPEAPKEEQKPAEEKTPEAGLEEKVEEKAEKKIEEMEISAMELAMEEIGLMAKEGRVLSKKTLALMDDAIGSMTNAISVLQELQKTASPEMDGEDKSAKGRPVEVHKSRKNRIKVRALQKIAKNINEILRQEKEQE